MVTRQLRRRAFMCLQGRKHRHRQSLTHTTIHVHTRKPLAAITAVVFNVIAQQRMHILVQLYSLAQTHAYSLAHSPRRTCTCSDSIPHSLTHSQPSQKSFETRLCRVLNGFRNNKHVWVYPVRMFYVFRTHGIFSPKCSRIDQDC